MNVCVFCSMSQVDEEFQVEAAAFATGLGHAGHTLVWGGSDRGLMKVCADNVQQAGGMVVGISMEAIKAQIRQGSDEMIIAASLMERKALLLERADVIVALPGGIGTLDELLEILELRKHRLHNKPILVLNTAGFYDGLEQQLRHMDALGFLPEPLGALMTFVKTSNQALALISDIDNAEPAR